MLGCFKARESSRGERAEGRGTRVGETLREGCTAFCLGARGGAGPRLEEGIGGSGRSAVLTEADMVDGSKEGEVVESRDGGGTG